MKKLLSQSIKILFLALLFGAVTVFAQWQAPSGTPSSMNAPTPLNTSATDQSKAGKLMIPGIQTGGLYVGPTGFTGIPNGGDVHIEGGLSIGSGVGNPTSGIVSASRALASGRDIVSLVGNIFSGTSAWLGTYLPTGTTGGIAAERFCLPGANGANCISGSWPSGGSTLPNGTQTGQMLSWDQGGTSWIVNSVIKNLPALNRVGINMPSGVLGTPTQTLDVDGNIRSRNLTAANPVLCHGPDGTIIVCAIAGGGGTLMPPGTTDQTLRHNGTAWVATSTILNDGVDDVTVNGKLSVKAPNGSADVLYLDSGTSVGTPTRISTDANYMEFWTTSGGGARIGVEAGALRLSNVTANSYVCTQGTGWFVPCTIPAGQDPLPPASNYNTMRYNGTAWVANNSIKDDGHTLSVGDQTYTNQPYDEYKMTVKRGGLLVDLSNVNASNYMGTNALTLNVNTTQNQMVSVLTNANFGFQFWTSAGGGHRANIYTGSINADGDIYTTSNVAASGIVRAIGSGLTNATLMASAAGDVVAKGNFMAESLNAINNPGATFPADVCANSLGKLVLCAQSSGNNVDTFITPGTTTWTVPAGVTSAHVQVFGAGGGGAGGNGIKSGGAGGGGGYVDVTLTVSPGQTYSIVVGSRGTGGATAFSTNAPGSGTAGGQSKFGTSYIANGGAGGVGQVGNSAPGGVGGTASAPTGATSSGAAGGDGVTQNPYNGGAGGYSGGGSSYTYGKGGNGGAGFTPTVGVVGSHGAVLITY